MKFGCGDFTKPCDPLAIDDSHTITQKIVDRYKQLFPKCDGLAIAGAGANHWAEIDNDSDYIEVDNDIIVSSDNGAGFKFAPVVAHAISKVVS